MSVTVKVLCSLTIFLVAFLGHGIAKYSEFNDRNYPDWDYQNNEGQYSEFVEDVYPLTNRERTVERHDKYYDREKHIDLPRLRRDKEFKEQLSNKYDKEQDWNAEEVEVEEGDEAVFEKVISEDLDSETKRRQKRSTTDYRDTRYKNHRYEDDLQIDETYPVPQYLSRGSKKTTQYEVHEVTDEEPDPLASETRTLSSPEILYHQGAAYVKVPNQEYSFVGGNEHQHLARDSAGAPPATRYTRVLDQASSATGKSHGHSHASGGGHQGHNQKKNEHGQKHDKGYKSVHHHEQGAKGSEGLEKHNKHYDEHGGKKKSHHDSAGHYGEHNEAGQGKTGAKFDEKKGHKKGHNTKGYHNKYHKDEYHKEHKFYDDYHKSGSHSRFGDFKGQHGSKEGGHHKKAHHDSAQDHKDAGKKGHYNKGHVDEAHKGHKNENGYEKHHSHHSDYGKKGGSHGGKEYGYKSGHKK